MLILPKAKKYKISTKNNDEAIGAIAAHESVHATDEQNIKDSKANKMKKKGEERHDVERVPVEVEKNVLQELFNLHNSF